MQRAQLLLPPAQAQFLQDEAERNGISMSELVRQWIAERMEAAGAVAAHNDAGDMLVGIGMGGIDNASERHDEEMVRARGYRVPQRAAMAAGA
jgi:hypothetical protein